MKRKKYNILSIVIVFTTIVIMFIFYNMMTGTRDQCWDTGDQMAVGKPATIIISAQEAKDLFGDDIDISASRTVEVGTAAYYHFKCHKEK